MIFTYWISLFYKWVEKIRNRHGSKKTTQDLYPLPLLEWCGVQYIHLHPNYRNNHERLIHYYGKPVGELDKVRNLSMHDVIAYDDHVSRIQTKTGKLETAVFTKPRLSATSYQTIELGSALLSANESKKIDHFAKEFPHLSDPPGPFDYTEMENAGSQKSPVCVGLPEQADSNFILNHSNELTENVLHLPIKISIAKEKELQMEGRVLPESIDSIRHDLIYIPKELASLKPLIQYACGIEQKFNPHFLEDCYLFLSVSHSLVEPNTTQRRGGWHVDGHQGYERVQKNGKKLPCDRQYTITNVLPTQAISHQYHFDGVRQYCKKTFCGFDAVNMQDVIEHQSGQVDSTPGKVTQIPVNQLIFFNPYIVHRAVANHYDHPVQRTFVRLLFSHFTRNRLGDSVNPVLGPLYPLKIKTITDVHEMDKKYFG